MDTAPRYRRSVKTDDLVKFDVIQREMSLAISSVKDLETQASSSLLTYQNDINGYIKSDPEFATSLEPIGVSGYAPLIVRAMAEAAAKSCVEPMTALAGAIAEFVGRDLVRFSDEVIVENNGAIFLKTKKRRVLWVYANAESQAANELAIEIAPEEDGMGACVLRGTASQALSFGPSDAIIILSDEAAMASATITAVVSILKSSVDTDKAIEFARSVSGINGILISMKNTTRSWGRIQSV